jgi:hypothetical protein
MRSFVPFVFAPCLIASIAVAETQSEINAFFGFEYILTPVAVKWSCGGSPDEDLAALEAIIAYNPKDAEEAELEQVIELLLEVSKRDTGMSEILGFEVADAEEAKLCAAAARASIPQEKDVEDAAFLAAWQAALQDFVAVIEEIPDK